MSLLAHRVDGVGEPVLLLNGGMMSISSWGPFAEELARSHRVIRCDLRGQLLSPGTPPPLLADHVPEVVSLLEALGAVPAHVIGASFGAEVALHLAARQPRAVASLVAITAVDRFPDEMIAGAAREAQACREAAEGGDRGRIYDLMIETTFTPAWVVANRAALAGRRAQIARLPAAWFEGLAGLLESLETVDLAPHLAAIRCPTLVVAAENDRIMPLERARAVADGIHGAAFEIVAGSGHAILLERPETLLPLCCDFLAALGRGVASRAAARIRGGDASLAASNGG